MKKLSLKSKILPAAALLVGLAVSAFTNAQPASSENKQQTYHWYNNDGSQYLGQSEEPSNGCTASGSGCAKGFTEIPGNPQTEVADATRAFN